MRYPTAIAPKLAATVLMILAASVAAQQGYPNKAIHVIVPFPPGASNDSVARLVAPKLTETLGQPVIVDNRPGGDTVIGSEALVKSPPDGYTLMLTSNMHVISPNLNPKLSYDVIKDFAPIATTTINQLVLVIHPSVPANNLQELIALAKAKPGQLNYASAGSGGPSHLAGELFNIMAGVKMQHVPYKGGAPGLADLIGAHVQLSFQSPVTAMAHIKSGKLRAIAISGEIRTLALHDVPTFAEAGLAGLDISFWQGILAPAGTPRQIIDKLSTEIGRIVILPDVKDKLNAQVMEPLVSTPDEFAALIRADLAKFARLIKTADIRREN